jgi:hypothetical protein
VPRSLQEPKQQYEPIHDVPLDVLRLAQRPDPPAGWTYYLILDLQDRQPKYSADIFGKLQLSHMESPYFTQFAPDVLFFRDGTVVLENRAYHPGERIVHSSPTLIAYRPAAPAQLLRITNQQNELYAFAFDSRGWWRYVPRDTSSPARPNPIPTRRELVYLAGVLAAAAAAILILGCFGGW